MLKADRQQIGKVSVVKVTGRLFEKDVVHFGDILEKEFGSNAGNLALDLSKITQVSSLALGVIVKYWKRFRAHGRILAIYRPTPVVRQLLEYTKLCTVVTVAESQEDLEGLCA